MKIGSGELMEMEKEAEGTRRQAKLYLIVMTRQA